MRWNLGRRLGIGEHFRATSDSAITSSIVRDIAETLAARVVLIAVGLVSSVVLARILGPTNRGLFAVAAAVADIGVQLGLLGLHASNTYFVARDRGLLPAIIGNVLLVAFVGGGLAITAAWLVFTVWPDIAPVTGPLLALALVSVPLGLAFTLMLGVLVGLQQMRRYNVVEMATRILGVVLVVVAVAIGWRDVEQFYALGVLTLILGCLLAFSGIAPHLHGRPHPSWPLFRDMLRYGLRSQASWLFMFVLLRIDVLMVNYILGNEETGFYAVATSMATLVYLLPVATGTVLFPRLSALATNVEKYALVTRSIRPLGILMIFAALVAGLGAAPAVEILFGASFLPAVPAFLWLLLAIVPLSLNTLYMNYFASIGQPAVVIYAPAFAASLNIGLNVALIPRFGIVGASIASVAAYTLMFLMSLAYVRRSPVRI